jgi:hypothetical protein
MRHLDKIAYTFLFLGLAVGFLAILRMRSDSTAQFLVILALVVFYFIWGIIYHNLKNDLTRKLFLEYLLLGIISVFCGFVVYLF